MRPAEHAALRHLSQGHSMLGDLRAASSIDQAGIEDLERRGLIEALDWGDNGTWSFEITARGRAALDRKEGGAMSVDDRQVREALSRLAPGEEITIPTGVRPRGPLTEGEAVRVGSPEYERLLQQAAEDRVRDELERSAEGTTTMRHAEHAAVSGWSGLSALARIGSIWGPHRRRMTSSEFRDAVVANHARLVPDEDPDYIARCFDDGRLAADFAATWFNSGLPRVVVSHRHAAALMATDVPPDAASAVTAPWDALVVDIPTGMLSFERPDGPREMRHYLVWRRNGVVVCDLFPRSVVANSPGRALEDALFRFEPPAEHLSICAGAEPGLRGSAKRNARAGIVGMRFLIGVLFELVAHRPSQAHARGPRIAKRSFRGEPVTTTFQLIRDVKVDARAAVRDYCRGVTRSAPGVQHLVRGHWKHQRCGAAGTDRKFIFIEPYWRGPEDAPIALRSHVLGAPEPT